MNLEPNNQNTTELRNFVHNQAHNWPLCRWYIIKVIHAVAPQIPSICKNLKH